ncbi:hypothetical protein QT972_07115 [Microcoleus sp. herbarium7]
MTTDNCFPVNCFPAFLPTVNSEQLTDNSQQPTDNRQLTINK